jgi:hypothetical protein
LSENIFSTFKSKSLNFVFYSVATDKSTNATEKVDENFKIMEEPVPLVPLQDTTALQNTLNTCQLGINNMSALTIDGAPALSGNKDGVVAMVKKERGRGICER